MKKPVLFVVGLAALAAMLVAIYWPHNEALTTDPYHNQNMETEEVFDYPTEQACLDGLAYPVESGTHIKWKSWKDGAANSEACSGTTNGSGGLWTSACCSIDGENECVRTNQPSVAAVKAYVASRLP